MDACLGSPEVQTGELSELLRLQDVLRLSPAQVGNKIFAAARNLYSRHRAYLEDTEDSESKRILNKFVFLAERVRTRPNHLATLPCCRTTRIDRRDRRDNSL